MRFGMIQIFKQIKSKNYNNPEEPKQFKYAPIII